MNTVRRWIVPGLVAGVVFLLLEIVFGAFTTTAWAFPQGIAATIRLGTTDHAAIRPLLTGLLVHLAVSVGLGVLFVLLADRLRLTGGTVIVAAWLFSGFETAIAIWVVLHNLLPTTLPLLLNSVPLWASIVGHNAFGLTLGFLVFPQAQAERVPNGQPSDQQPSER